MGFPRSIPQNVESAGDRFQPGCLRGNLPDSELDGSGSVGGKQYGVRLDPKSRSCVAGENEGGFLDNDTRTRLGIRKDYIKIKICGRSRCNFPSDEKRSPDLENPRRDNRRL